MSDLSISEAEIRDLLERMDAAAAVPPSVERLKFLQGIGPETIARLCRILLEMWGELKWHRKVFEEREQLLERVKEYLNVTPHLLIRQIGAELSRPFSSIEPDPLEVFAKMIYSPEIVVAAEQGRKDFEEGRVVEVKCTGLTASWCPIHGNCICSRAENGEWLDGQQDFNCSLHGEDSKHACGE